MRSQSIASARRRITPARGVYAALLILGSAAFLLPLLWMLSTSLKTPPQIVAYPPVWVPRPLRWMNYWEAMSSIPFFVYIKNTMIYCVLAVIGAAASNTLVGYSFAKMEWPLKNVIFILTLATLMIPSQVTLIPVYIMMRAFHWTNTYLPMVVPIFFGNAFFIFMLRQFFSGIPEELSNSARIDGATDAVILTRIVLPLSKPALSVVILFQFIWAWRDFLGPLIYLNNELKYPISLGLQQFLSVHGNPEWGMLMAACVLTTLPILVIFLVFQGTFIQGIALSGLKG